MRPKPATSMAAARGNAPPTLLPAARRTPTRVKPAARSAATKHWDCSWTVCPQSSATGCSSAHARPKVVQNDADRQSCQIAPIKIRRNPTVWSYGGSAARTHSAGKRKKNGGWHLGCKEKRKSILRGVAGLTFVLCACMSVCVCVLRVQILVLCVWDELLPNKSEDSLSSFCIHGKWEKRKLNPCES